MIHDQPLVPRSNREVLAGGCIEWKSYSVSETYEPDVIRVFGLHLRSAKVLFDTDEIGKTLLAHASNFYVRGPELSAQQLERERLYYFQKILSMTDDHADGALFLRHFGVLFSLSVKLWFEIGKSSYSEPLYLALPKIKNDDPGYFDLLCELLAANSRDKIPVAKLIYARLFGAEPPISH